MWFRWRNDNRRKAGDEVLPTQGKNNDKNAKIKIVCDCRELCLYGPSSDYRDLDRQRYSGDHQLNSNGLETL